MADVITGDSAVSLSKMDLIVAIAQKELAQSTKLLNTITNVSQFAEKGNVTINFPKYSSFSVTKKTSGTPVDASSLTEGIDTLDLSEQAVVQYLIEKKASKQTRINLEMEYASRAASAMGRQIDTDIVAELANGAAGNDVAGVIATGITLGNILDMRLALDVAFAPEEGRWLAVNPAQEKELLSIDKFQSGDYIANKPLVSGFIGQIFGINVIKSTLVPASTSYMYHSEACAIGFQIDPTFDEQKDLANLGMRYSIDQLYGIKLLQGGNLVSILTLV